MVFALTIHPCSTKCVSVVSDVMQSDKLFAKFAFYFFSTKMHPFLLYQCSLFRFQDIFATSFEETKIVNCTTSQNHRNVEAGRDF